MIDETKYINREWNLPGEFPDPPNSVGFNRQWIPVDTEVFCGWFLLPLELSAAQLAETEKRLAVEPEEGDTTPRSVMEFRVIQHLILDARIDGLEPDMWRDPTGLSMPSVQLARAMYQEGVKLIVRARSLGNLLRPFSGTLKAETANNLAATGAEP